ncbi:MAG: hypothetical protein JWM56_871 [Candidatus Peribacteria bacterium]|nr:hypothetical protein [Candidatus Peribacteria bacterium]
MLRFSPVTREALNHSPLREQREVFFADAPSGTPGHAPIDPTDTVTSSTTNPNPQVVPPQSQTAPPPDAETPATDEEEAVNGARNTTRTHVADALSEGGTASENLLGERETGVRSDAIQTSDVISSMESHLNKRLKLQKDMAETQDFLLPAMSSKVQQDWKANFVQLSLDVSYLHKAIDDLELLQKWESGEISLTDYARFLSDNWGKNPEEYETRQEILARISEHIASTAGRPPDEGGDATLGNNAWQGLNPSSRLVARSKAEEVLAGTAASEITNFYKEVSKKMSGSDRQIDELSKVTQQVRDAMELEKTAKVNRMSVQLFSFNQIMAAGKSITDAFKETIKRRDQLKTAQLAHNLGKAAKNLPYGKEVSQIVDSTLDGKNEEAKGGYLKYLKNFAPGFEYLFDEGGEMDRVMKDPNLAMAVLEYAADAGFLYDIDEMDLNDKLLRKYRLAEIVPPSWDKDRVGNYFIKLRSQNKNGEQANKKGTKERENKDNFKDFLDIIDQQFAHKNYWGAVGVMERAIERGLSDVVITRLAVMFFRYLRENEAARYYFSKNRLMMEAFGGLSIYKTTPTLGYFKAERKPIQAWLKNDDRNVANAGTLGRVINVIEKDIQEKMGLDMFERMETKERDDLVAKILTGQFVNHKGHKFTLYDKRYKFYVDLEENGYFKSHFTSNPHKEEDSDMFIENTEQILGNVVTAITAYGSTREFEGGKNVTAFMQKFINQAKELKSNGLENEYKNFIVQAQKRWNNRIDGILRDSNVERMASIVMNDGFTPALAALVNAKIVDPLIIFKAAVKENKSAGASLARQIIEQLRTFKDFRENWPPRVIKQYENAVIREKAANQQILETPSPTTMTGEAATDRRQAA